MSIKEFAKEAKAFFHDFAHDCLLFKSEDIIICAAGVVLWVVIPCLVISMLS